MKNLQDRYSRQAIFEPIGKEGQALIRKSKVLVVGCGALGSNAVNFLARAGVGFLRVVDRDVLELSNLQRQVMFDEKDVADNLPKAEAAKRHLAMINSEVEVQAVVSDVNPRTAPNLVEGMDFVIDATDNFETRYLLNDLCAKNKIPWIYGGVIGSSGAAMTVMPDGPCLACVFPETPQPGQAPTCHTAGVLNTAPAVIAAIQVTETLKLIVKGQPRPILWQIDLWSGQSVCVKVRKNAECPVCVKGEYRFLNANATQWVTSLCGRDTVQITPAQQVMLDLKALKKRLSKIGSVTFNGFLLTAEIEGTQFTVFPDGRVMVHGVSDETVAKNLHARFIGS